MDSLTIAALNGILKDLDKEILKQFSKRKSGMDMTEIKNILAKIDDEIVNDTTISKEMIEGSSESRAAIKAEIERVNEEAKKKIETLLRRAEVEADKNSLKNVIKNDIQGSKTSKAQSELDKLDGMEIKTKDMKTRYGEANKKVNDLSTRIAKATLYKKVVNLKSPALTPKDLKDSRGNTEKELNEARKSFNSAQTIKSADDYEKMFNELYTRATEASLNPYKSEDFIKFNDTLKEFRKISRKNPEISGLIFEIESNCIKKDPKGKISSIDSDKLKDSLLKFKDIDWDKATKSSKEALKEDAYKKVEGLLKNEAILKMRPK